MHVPAKVICNFQIFYRPRTAVIYVRCDCRTFWNSESRLLVPTEAQLFGVFSDNRIELAEPYFAVLQNAVELGRWRAGLKTWHSGSFGHVAGQNINSFQNMEQTGVGGQTPVPAAYKGIELPIHLSPWPARAYFPDDCAYLTRYYIYLYRHIDI